MNDNFSKINTMKYWTQMVLPQAYDDSLSYMEVLARVTKILNQLVENNNLIPDFIKDLIIEYISSGVIGEIVSELLSKFILNVKNPPNNLKPAKGDGSEDDTQALQGCIDYANANGGMFVYFPSGSYLTQSLTLKNNVSLGGFDKSTTKIVLKGGATQPLLKGTTVNNTITKLTLNANMGIQVNDVDVVELTGGKWIFTELEITYGYTLAKLHLTDSIIASDLLFGEGVIDALVVDGNGKALFENVMIDKLSSLSGRYSISNSVNNAVFTGFYINATTQTAINNSGNNCVYEAKIINAVSPINDTGSNTYTNFYQKGGSLHEEIVKEKLDREDADTVLQGNINTEKTERIANDNILQGNIDNETLARQTADTNLQNNINAEKTAREDADNVLNTKINTEITNRVNAISDVNMKIDNEVIDRQIADADLQNNINAEKTARENADIAIRLDASYINALDLGFINNGTSNNYAIFNNVISNYPNGINIFFPNGTYLIGTSLVLPQKINLMFASSAVISLPINITLSIKGSINAQLNKIFDGEGFVIGLGKVYPEWWGADNTGVTDSYNAIYKAIYCMDRCFHEQPEFIFSKGTYLSSKTINFTPTAGVNMTIRGAGSVLGTRLLPATSFIGESLMHIHGSDKTTADLVKNYLIKDFSMEAVNSFTGKGLQIGDADPQLMLGAYNPSLIQNLNILNFERGLNVKNARLINFENVAIWNEQSETVINATFETAGNPTGDFNFSACQFICQPKKGCNILVNCDEPTIDIKGLRFLESIFYNGNKSVTLTNAGVNMGELWFCNCQWDGNINHAIYATNTFGKIDDVQIVNCYFRTPNNSVSCFYFEGSPTALIENIMINGGWYANVANAVCVLKNVKGFQANAVNISMFYGGGDIFSFTNVTYGVISNCLQTDDGQPNFYASSLVKLYAGCDFINVSSNVCKSVIQILVNDSGNSNINLANSTFNKKQNGGIATFTGDGTATTFTINHGLSVTPSAFSVTANNADSAKEHYAVVNSSVISITFTTPPANSIALAFNWFASSLQM